MGVACELPPNYEVISMDPDIVDGYTYSRQGPGGGIGSQRESGSQADGNVELHDEWCLVY